MIGKTLFAIAIVLVVVPSCYSEQPTRKLPVSVNGDRNIDMGRLYSSSNCQGLMYTSYDAGCADTVVFEYAGRKVSAIVVAYVDTDKRVLRVETSYSMSSAVIDSFIDNYRSVLRKFGWEIGDAVKGTALIMKEDVLLATDSTMSVWMGVPTFEHGNAKFWISCFIRA